MAQERSITVLKNTLSNYMRHFVNVGVFLLLTPYVANKLGTESYGLWSLLWSTVGLFVLFDLGFSPSVVKYVADARGRNDIDRLNRLTATFFWIHVILGSLAFVVALFFVPFLAYLLKIPPHLATSARIVFLLLAFRVAQSMPLGLFASVLVAHQRQAWANVVKVIGTLLYAGSVFAVFEYKATVENIAWCNLLTAVVANFILVALCLKKLSGVKLSPRWFDKSLVREITSFSVFTIIMYIASLLYTRVDAIIIQEFLSLTKVAYYNVAMMTVDKAGLLTGQLNKALTPMFAELKGAGDETAIRKIYFTGTKLSTAMAAPLLVGLMWFAGPLIIAWMGAEFEQTVLPMQILIGAMIFNTIHDNARTLLVMTGYHRFLTVIVIAGQLLNLGLTIAVANSYGLFGVAGATLVSAAITNTVIIYRACAIHRFSIFSFFYKAVGPSLFPCALMLGILFGIEQIFEPTSLLSVAVLEALACGVFFAAFYLVGLDGEERSYYKTKLGRLLKKR